MVAETFNQKPGGNKRCTTAITPVFRCERLGRVLTFPANRNAGNLFEWGGTDAAIVGECEVKKAAKGYTSWVT